MKNKAAQSLGSRGGKSRALKLTEKQRKAIARKAGLASGRMRKSKILRREDLDAADNTNSG